MLLRLVIFSLLLGSLNGDFGQNEDVDLSKIPTPPMFVHETNTPVVYFSLDNTPDRDNLEHLKSRTFNCKAAGNPKPTYKWLKNGIPFPLEVYANRIHQKAGEGTFTISQLNIDDQGEYQCMAVNDNGTAISEKIKFEAAFIQLFEEERPEIVQVELGDPYTRNCTPPASNPSARVYWILMGSETGSFGTINSSHISTNDQGTIFFHHVKETDFKPNRYYTCTAELTQIKDYKFGSQFKLDVTKLRRRSLEESMAIPPAEQYVNQSSPIALVGQIHKLHCLFSGYPEPTPIWYKDGVEISQDNLDGFYFEAYGKTLTFNVTFDKAGQYQCRFHQHNDIDRSFQVVVDAAPYWPDGPPANTNTSEGETVVFDCQANGKPVPVVTFYKNGVEMKKENTPGNWEIDGTKLSLYNVKKGINGMGDNSVYQCKAENKHGYLWTNFYLNLLAFAPRLLEEPGEVEAIYGRPFVLECRFFSSPLANVTWENPSLLGDEYRTEVDSLGVGRLIIERVNENHAGSFDCVGKNKYGTARGTVNLSVRKATVLKPFSEREQLVQAGRALRLPCIADHDRNLAVSYTWRVDGLPIDQSKLESGQFAINPDNTLVIANPTHFDSGEYSCTASTKLDSVSKSIQISVQDVPNPIYAGYISKCDQKTATATINFEHLEPKATIAPVREFWIRYMSDPSVEVAQWRVHPVPVSATENEALSTERHIKANTTINLKPYGKYVFQVIARNSVGDSSPYKVKGTCETAEKQPNRNPAAVQINSTSPSQLTIVWEAMPRDEWNGPEFGYEVQYRAKDGNGEWKSSPVADPFADRFTVEFDEPQPYRPYEVRVRAKNRNGLSLVEPATIAGRTGEAVPELRPENFRVENVGATSATFHWDPVDESQIKGNFTGYRLTFWFDDEDLSDEHEVEQTNGESMRMLKRHTRHIQEAGRQRTVIVAPGVSSVTVHDLKPNAQNYAVVQVLTAQHEGPKSEVLTFRTREGSVPSPVRELSAYPMNGKEQTERGVVFLRWDRPRAANGRITHYTIQTCRTHGANEEHVACQESPVEVAANVTEIRLPNLEFESNYRFRVLGHTRSGAGAPNSADAKTLPEALRLNLEPSRPSLNEDGIGDDHFNISFVPGEYDAEEQRPVGSRFYAKVREEGETDWKIYNPNEDSLSLKVDGLAPGTRYEVETVSVQTDSRGGLHETESRIHRITTKGMSQDARFYMYIFLLLLLILLLITLCILCCWCCRKRGQKYPVSKKERMQGRELILPKDRGFADYGRTDDDEQRSLTGSRTGESETDSMAEYGDGDPGRFTEDGSFIGQYGPNKTLVVVTERT
ncbi:Neuroglian [Aphelenchoides besseyi]|nr:Neuroglian [Aphelenchoides besseyi]KAI6212027.1 Neuroglian [Aphelenchoides besseyi]